MTECVFLFPGQGSQSAGMGQDIYDGYASARAVFDAADAAVDIELKKLCFEGPDEDLTLTPNAQPCVTAVNLAVLAVLREKGIAPVAAAGHSLGEYAADCAAGVFSVEDAVRLTASRGKLMQACADRRPGSMVAVIGLPMEDVAAACAEVASSTSGVVSVANYNSPSQVVITGEKDPVAKAAELLAEKGAKRTVALNVSGPWHSSLMADAQEEFSAVLDSVTFAVPTIPVYTNVDGEEKCSGSDVREALKAQVTGSVYWTQTILKMRECFPDAVFIECGPGKVLKGLMRGIDRDAKCYDVSNAATLAAFLEKIG